MGSVKNSPNFFANSFNDAPQRLRGGFRVKLAYVIIFFAIGILLYVNYAVLQIKEVVLSPNNSEIKNELASNLRGKSILFTELDSITQELLTKYPQYSELVCRRSIPSVITCLTKDRTPVATWSSNDKTFGVDRYGIAFESNVADLLNIEDAARSPVTPGNAVITEQFLESYFLFAEKLKVTAEIKKIVVKNSLIQPTFVVNYKGSDLEVLINLENDIQLQADTFAKFIQSGLYNPTKKIDLRVSGKLYVQ